MKPNPYQIADDKLKELYRKLEFDLLRRGEYEKIKAEIQRLKEFLVK
jgi:hypothetical protein